ncbi:hypothetical protein V8C86DRAFT_1233066 [Haematococcus lacustris]
MAEKCDVALRKLAITLIQHLVNTGVHTEGSTPQVSALAEELLTQLLSRHPPMYWDPSCLVALMGVLETEEGDSPLSALRGHTSAAGSSPLVWKVVRSWVYSAALAAPMRTEALLHEIMAPDIMRQGGQLPPLRARAAAAALRRSNALADLLAEASSRSHTGGRSRGMAVKVCLRRQASGCRASNLCRYEQATRKSTTDMYDCSHHDIIKSSWSSSTLRCERSRVQFP